MTMKRLPWDGPLPSPGDYIDTRVAGHVWLIRKVTPMRRPNAFGERVLLELVPRPRQELPGGALVHPPSRATHHDPEGPERVRQTAGGHGRVMRSAWRDPDDLRPLARSPREISGWRSFCVLRTLARLGAAVSFKHIAAADYLRCEAEIAALGFSAPRNDLIPVGERMHGPRPGFSDAALAQTAALRSYQRAMRSFTAAERALLEAVVIRNTPLPIWCKSFAARRIERETGKLLGILDRLAEHYGAEIEAQERRGETMVAA